MKNKFHIFIIITMIMVIIAGSNSSLHMTSYKIKTTGMSEKAARIVASAVMIKTNGLESDEWLVSELINNYNLYPDDATVAINALVNGGMLTEYIGEFKNAGIPINTSSSKATSENTTVSKTEYTVTDLTPYTAWAIKDCNIRSGADTTYDKVGSLKQYEEVTVTGKASTGWFRITTSNGTEAYISDSLLTTEDPKSVTVTTVEENGDIVTATVEGENAETVAKVVEELKEEETVEVHEHIYTSSVTKEATCTEDGIITYTCECGDTYTEEIPATGHIEGEWEITKNPSLIVEGERVQKCTVCGEILNSEIIPAKTNVLIGVLLAGAVIVVGTVIGVVAYKKKH